MHHNLFDWNPLTVRLVIFFVILGFAYWYWSGPHQESAETAEAERLTDNAATMQRCINHEKRLETAANIGGLVDIGSSGKDAEQLCADKNNLYLRDGSWYNK